MFGTFLIEKMKTPRWTLLPSVLLFQEKKKNCVFFYEVKTLLKRTGIWRKKQFSSFKTDDEFLSQIKNIIIQINRSNIYFKSSKIPNVWKLY